MTTGKRMFIIDSQTGLLVLPPSGILCFKTTVEEDPEATRLRRISEARELRLRKGM